MDDLKAISQGDVLVMLDAMRNLLWSCDRLTATGANRVNDGGVPGTLVKVPDATAAALRELLARYSWCR